MLKRVTYASHIRKQDLQPFFNFQVASLQKSTSEKKKYILVAKIDEKVYSVANRCYGFYFFMVDPFNRTSIDYF